jgi:hypothetical protein
MLSDNTLTCLRTAGWSEDYRADITHYQQVADADGYPLPAIVVDFLTRFGRLKITYPLDPGKYTIKSQLQPPATLTALLTYFYRPDIQLRRHEVFFLGGDHSPIREDLEWMAEKIGVDSVFSIGRLRDEGDLLMDLEGKVYLFFGSSNGGAVQFVASSGEEALEVLCSDTETTTIKSW